VTWPDILIGAVLIFAVLKGFKRGFVMEIAGAVALLLAVIAPWFYNGAYDAPLQRALHLAPGPTHVAAMVLVGIAVYVAVMLFARVVNAMARLPVIGTGNALAGAALGLLKAAVAVWVVLYIALFFPLSHGVRADLHRSILARTIAGSNAAVDERLIATLPSFARPFVRPLFARHHV
jgi:uncharacterized membrane protein required for colicin V production